MLLDLVAAAVTDFRDVLMWASQPEPDPEQRAEARARKPIPPDCSERLHEPRRTSAIED